MTELWCLKSWKEDFFKVLDLQKAVDQFYQKAKELLIKNIILFGGLA
jgi:hypothetical protein